MGITIAVRQPMFGHKGRIMIGSRYAVTCERPEKKLAMPTPCPREPSAHQ